MVKRRAKKRATPRATHRSKGRAKGRAKERATTHPSGSPGAGVAPHEIPRRAAVGVLGGSGYIGAELLRYLAAHPRVEIRWASARSKAGVPIADVLPNLRGFVGGSFLSAGEAEKSLAGLDAVFVALPQSESQEAIPRLATDHPRTVFIDMGGDFRTDNPEGYREHYDHEHSAVEWLPRFVYGFTEFQREKLKGARLIANPGCFASSILLALAPLAARQKLEGDYFLSSVTGSSGSGNTPSGTTHHPERAANFRAYKPLAHQHLLEVSAFLRTLTTKPFRIHFVPHSGPFVRGIFTTAFFPLWRAADLENLYRDAYGDEPLIAVGKGSPDLRWVQGTPRSHIGIAGGDGSRKAQKKTREKTREKNGEQAGEKTCAVAFVAIDNLGKGAAGQAIQNFNRAMGFAETDGLLVPGGFV